MMCSPVRHNKLFGIQKSDNAPSALLCVAVGNQNTSRGKHRRSWAGASPWLCSVTLFPWYYRFILIVTLQKKDINILYIKMPLTFMSSLTQQPSGCSFTTSSSTSCPWRTSTTPSLPCTEKKKKSHLHGWKLALEEKFKKISFQLLCHCCADAAELAGSGRRQNCLLWS